MKYLKTFENKKSEYPDDFVGFIAPNIENEKKPWTKYAMFDFDEALDRWD